jgi:DNA uptake protein ComE-like DNA-binding protein
LTLEGADVSGARDMTGLSMRIATFVIIACSVLSMSAAADDMKLKPPPPDAFGNEPANAITPEAAVLINKMSEQDMLRHKSIGSEYTRRVMANRPYTGFDDFRLRSGLPEANYEKLKPLLDF